MTTRSPTIKPNVVAEASAWFVEFRSGDMTSGMRARFDDWLRRSPEHIQAYLEVAAGWSELPTADPDGRIDIQALLTRAGSPPAENVIPLNSAERSVRRAGRSRWAPAIAASLVCLTVAIYASAWFLTHRETTYSTGIGEQRTVILADGTTVVLNALTTVRARITQRIREVDLQQGQALFHDVEDETRPFVVRSDGTTIRAIGTQFDVHQRADGTVITVIEGQVAVAETAVGPGPSSPFSFGTKPKLPLTTLSPVLLSAGEQVIVTPRQIEKPVHADVPAATAWVEKRLVFDNTPLQDAAEQFNLYSPRPLIIVDPALRSVGISGVYSSADPGSLIGFLRAQPNLVVTETSREFRVALRKGPN